MKLIGEKLKHLPEKPGVYLFKDQEGTIIYVGKAISLKNRVRSYCQSENNQTIKAVSMMKRAVDFDYIVTDSEIEALILESNLIKEHRPKYNIVLKDDKSYPYIKVTLQETYPRVYITRKVLKDGAKYYGPYTKVGAVHETLALLRRLFPLRTCKQKEFLTRNRPCLNYHIKKCLAPCSNLVLAEDYAQMVQKVCLFLDGKYNELVSKLTKQMEDAAEDMAFEEAAKIRDQMLAIKAVLEKQKIVTNDKSNRDIIALAYDEEFTFCLMLFFIRAGKLLGKERFIFERMEGSTKSEIISAFLKQYYLRADFIPGEILVSDLDSSEEELILKWLEDKKGGKVYLKIPQKGEKKKLLEMVEKNAQLGLEEFNLERVNKAKAGEDLDLLTKALNLKSPPFRLECFDISNTQGTESVASMVVFENGKLAREEYRKFKIKTVEGANDFASIYEAVYRRFSRAKEEKALMDKGQLSSKQAKFYKLPDLLLIDGGKGQLSMANRAMKNLGLDYIPTYGLAKEEELLFSVEKSEPISLGLDSKALQLLQRLRDEAHRFAISYHRQLRTKRNLKSLLDEIEGIGAVRRKALLKAFPSLEAISKASLEEISSLPGMNKRAAMAVLNFLGNEERKDMDNV